MNDKQVEYTKQEIKKYSEEIDDLWFKINRSGVFAFLGTGQESQYLLLIMNNKV